MSRYLYFVLFGLLVTMSAPVFAESRAVNISIGSIGGALDNAALRTVRQVVGHAVARGTVDQFVVRAPRAGGPIPIEGGLWACAEAGYNIKTGKFNSFIKELRSIQPKAGTFYNVERTTTCMKQEAVFCTREAKLCPDGTGVSRVPPFCEFEPCPGE